MRTHKVIITEYERGWGSSIVDIKLFETEEIALLYCEQFNAQNTETKVPDWYMRADYVGEIK